MVLEFLGECFDLDLQLQILSFQLLLCKHYIVVFSVDVVGRQSLGRASLPFVSLRRHMLTLGALNDVKLGLGLVFVVQLLWV